MLIYGQWVFLRIALVYGPAWVCITASLCLYVLAGIEIFRKRSQLVKFKDPHRQNTEVKSPAVENPFTDFKTTEIQISSEPATNTPLGRTTPSNALSPNDSRYLAIPTPTVPSDQQSYFVTTIRSTPSRLGSDYSIPTVAQSPQVIQQRRKQRAAVEFNTAALGYTKVALLFFCSLIITWVPPSVNRFNSLLHPNTLHIPSSYATSVVLPLMGFWNSVIYIVTSWAVVRKLFTGQLSRTTPPTRPSRRISIPGTPKSWSRKGSESDTSLEGLASGNPEWKLRIAGPRGP